MIELRRIGRVTVDRWLRVTRFPLDAAAQLLPEDGGPREGATLFLDRFDAEVRAAAGGLLNDDMLRQEAQRRRAAVRERQRALLLRREAGQRSEAADEQLADSLERSAHVRQSAELDARRREASTAREIAERQRQVERVAVAQDQAVKRGHDLQVAAQERKAERERLRVLEDQADALEQEAAALDAAENSQRLRKAANAAKAERKKSSS